MIQSKELQGAAVGVFDSGVGGLTVAREIMRQIPNEKIVYFGDTARVPYGSKSQDTVTRYSRQIVRFLRTQDVKAIVVACNTASAYALDSLEKEIDIPIIGVVKPGARVAAEVTRNGKIGVIGTEGTIGSQIYTDFIHNINPDAKVTGKACPLFVPLVEEGLLQDPVTDEIASRYLTELIDIGIDTLILKKLLTDCNLLNPQAPALGDNKYKFYVSDGAEKFKRFANSIIKYGILSAKTIQIEEY